MLVFLLDLESTGLDTTQARITEIGAMICSFSNGKYEKLFSLSQLCWDIDYPPITEEVTRVTGITQELLLKEAKGPGEVMKMLSDMVETYKPKYSIAFNRNYDEVLFRYEANRGNFGSLQGIKELLETPWICGMADIESHNQYKSWKLSHLALDYGVTVNPKELHRAIGDVELMRQMMEAASADPDIMYAYQKEPRIYARAITEKPWTDGGKSNEAAKKLGFNWEVPKGAEPGVKFATAWVKRIRESEFEKLEKEAPFKVLIIKET
jgi:DNA polymerase III alpha subunit (gram-positive type)